MRYEFECKHCLITEEIELKVSERNLEQECNICGGKLNRLLSAPANTWKTDGNADGRNG